MEDSAHFESNIEQTMMQAQVQQSDIEQLEQVSRFHIIILSSSLSFIVIVAIDLFLWLLLSFNRQNQLLI